MQLRFGRLLLHLPNPKPGRNILQRHNEASQGICLALEEAIVDRLGLPSMVADNRTSRKTAFTVLIEARTGVTTGISAFERARTIQAATMPDAVAADIVSPDHVFPLRAVPGGVLARAGHTEGSVDLMRIAELRAGAVICELMNDDGQMARMPDIRSFAERHDIPILTIAEVAAYRVASEKLVEEVATARLPSVYAPDGLEARAFRSLIDGREHLALVKGPLKDGALVRVHSECLTGDALGSLRCDCGAQLRSALKQIGESDGGALIYLHGHEGRGVGLMAAALSTETPISFGILTTYTDQHAQARSGDGAFNKGRAVAAACFDTVMTLRRIRTVTEPTLFV